MQHLKLCSLTLLAVLVLASCEKDTSVTAKVDSITNAARQVASCDALAYADSIFYVNDAKKNYIVTPKKSVAGTYTASPAGLQINPSSGAIDINTSETGLRYKVSFVAKNSGDTCSQYITIGGVDYLSALYSLAANDTLASPIYYGNSPTGLPVGSLFDDAPAGESVSSLGVSIGQLSGKINLKRTVTGLFGTTPANGSSKVITLYYRLNDASKKAKNKLKIKFVYYARKSDVPADLLAQTNTQNARIGASSPSGAGSVTAHLLTTREPRPPVIVVTL